ncbi:MAG TPA: TlpA disulfide reductase family protein [Lysobacter sp.]|nr:TlpA disulfide reductase family protein [Lysobacter sp.]
MRTAVLAAALMAGLTACGRNEPAPEQPAVEVETAPARVQPVEAVQPRLQVTTIDGARFDLAQHRGRFVVVNFWATWCGPCIKEMPELSRLAERGDVDVIGLAYEEIEPDAMREFLKARPVSYPIAILDTYKPLPDFETPRGLPMTLLIAPDGRVAMKVAGAVTMASIDEAIRRHVPSAQG